MAKFNIGQNVKLFGQETGVFCGEASAKMTLNGFPKAADRHVHKQTDLKTIIEHQNSTVRIDHDTWNTDPKGLQECLELLSTNGAKWMQVAPTNSEEAQEFIQQCIEVEQFPTPVLVQEGKHWVVVVGWETEEVVGGSPKLKFMHYHDPEPGGKGSYGTKTGDEWALYFAMVKYEGTWKGKFVAVGKRP